jgi:hypothetical protein
MLNISNIDSVLSKYNLYYRLLSLKGKERFNFRIVELSKQISIIGRDFEVYFKDQFLNEFPEAREFYPEDQPKNPATRGAFVNYEIGRSQFGFMVVKEKYVLDISAKNNIH